MAYFQTSRARIQRDPLRSARDATLMIHNVTRSLRDQRELPTDAISNFMKDLTERTDSREIARMIPRPFVFPPPPRDKKKEQPSDRDPPSLPEGPPSGETGERNRKRANPRIGKSSSLTSDWTRLRDGSGAHARASRERRIRGGFRRPMCSRGWHGTLSLALARGTFLDAMPYESRNSSSTFEPSAISSRRSKPTLDSSFCSTGASRSEGENNLRDAMRSMRIPSIRSTRGGRRSNGMLAALGKGPSLGPFCFVSRLVRESREASASGESRGSRTIDEALEARLSSPRK